MTAFAHNNDIYCTIYCRTTAASIQSKTRAIVKEGDLLNRTTAPAGADEPDSLGQDPENQGVQSVEYCLQTLG
jgi:hypothetical protein